MSESDRSMESVAVVAVPFPAQGHLNQMLHLSLLLASRGLDVHYAAPPPHVRQARARVNGWDDHALGSIRFHDLEISTYESPAPDTNAASSCINHLLPMLEVFSAEARAPLATLLDNLSATRRRVVVVYDRQVGFPAVEAARLRNGEAYGLQCIAISYYLGVFDPGHELLREHGLVCHPMEACTSKEILEYVYRTGREGMGAPVAGVVLNSCLAVESDFIHEVARHPHPAFHGVKHYAIGPLNPLPDAASGTAPGQVRHECMDWLDKQPPASVLYVSFGTTSTLRGEQVAELAAALKGSKQRFIWVLRDADRSDIFADASDSGESRHAELLSEFRKETEGQGLVITGWAPQPDILAHGATAAFMSHCGWNSVMESLSHGKPMLTWPMNSDQPWNADLVCKYHKAGLYVRPFEKRGEVMPAKAIQDVIEEAMVSEKGMAVRQRAKEIGEAALACLADDGSSRKDLDDFIAHITR